MKPMLTINRLIDEAKDFCEVMSCENHLQLLGIITYLSVTLSLLEAAQKGLICRKKIYAQTLKLHQ